MTQRLLESEGVQLALPEIAAARGHLRRASDTLTAFGAAEAMEEAPGLAKTLVYADTRRQLYRNTIQNTGLALRNS